MGFYTFFIDTLVFLFFFSYICNRIITLRQLIGIYTTMDKKQYRIIDDEVKMVSEPTAAYNSGAAIVPGQITVNIEDMSMLKDIKRAISMIRGVISVEKSPAMKSYERARADIRAGRVVECKDKEDFFAKLGL